MTWTARRTGRCTVRACGEARIEGSAAKVNLPNQLTLSRVIMIPVFVALLEASYLHIGAGWRTLLCALALLVYAVASVTDLIDGLLARRWNMITDFGKLFDPLADKLLLTAALVVFVYQNLFHGWVVVIILSREFIVTGLRSLGERAGRTISADTWGKAKTISQTVVIVAGLIYLTVQNAVPMNPQWAALWDPPGHVGSLSRVFLDFLMAICIVMTIASGATYLWRHWDLVGEGHGRARPGSGTGPGTPL
jgi:CDP-diacylglycerol--glycerol-3-phosphate 3-phosphatidyltransferase